MADLDRPMTVECFQASDIFLFPSSIECSPIVLFECMASRTPFLATDVGNTREIVNWSESGLVLPTLPNNALNYPGRRLRNMVRDVLYKLGISKPSSPHDSLALADVEGSARLLEDLWRDPGRLLKMANNGNRIWSERFTWGKIAGDYERLYHGLVSGVKNKNGLNR
jgi:L-malate glycosyltransferase